MTTADRPRVLLGFDHFAKYSVGLAGGLAARGCPVSLLCRTHDHEFGGEDGAMRAFVEQRLGDRTARAEIDGRVRDLSALPTAWSARRTSRRFAPDVVHLQDSVVDDVRVIAASPLARSRLVMTVHDPSPHPGDMVRSRWQRALRSALIRRAALVFVHGDALREELIEHERPHGAVAVVPHGVDDMSRAPLPEEPSLLFFGRLSFYKGLDTLLDAMPAVWTSAPSTRLVVAGSGPLPEHPVLADPRVTVRHEHVPEAEVPVLFARSTCLVLPYRQASQSGVGSLAKAHGRAIVATAVGGLPQLVTPEIGRLVPPEDPTALAGAVLEVVTDRGRADAMGEAAARSGAGTSWTEVARLTLEAYGRHLDVGHPQGDKSVQLSSSAITRRRA